MLVAQGLGLPSYHRCHLFLLPPPPSSSSSSESVLGGVFRECPRRWGVHPPLCLFNFRFLLFLILRPLFPHPQGWAGPPKYSQSLSPLLGPNFRFFRSFFLRRLGEVPLGKGHWGESSRGPGGMCQGRGTVEMPFWAHLDQRGSPEFHLLQQSGTVRACRRGKVDLGGPGWVGTCLSRPSWMTLLS